jgi:Zn-dependent hydrolases, including glyoxylases
MRLEAEPTWPDRFVVGPHKANSYLATYRGESILVDPGDDAPSLIARINDLARPLKAIVLTHGHWDHLGAAATVQSHTNVQVLLHRSDERLAALAPIYAAQIDRRAVVVPRLTLFDSASGLDALCQGVSFIHVPGHTRGSVAYRIGSGVFTGDTLLKERCGAARRPFGNSLDLKQSLATLSAWLDPLCRIFPGHGGSWLAVDAIDWLRSNLTFGE